MALQSAVVLAVISSAAGTLLLTRRRGRRRTAAILRALGATGTIFLAALTLVPAWEDSGAFAAVLVGVPLACAWLAVYGGDRRPALAWVAAAGLLAWSLLTAGGLGLYLLAPAVVLVAAAVATTTSTPAPQPP